MSLLTWARCRLCPFGGAGVDRVRFGASIVVWAGVSVCGRSFRFLASRGGGFGMDGQRTWGMGMVGAHLASL